MNLVKSNDPVLFTVSEPVADNEIEAVIKEYHKPMMDLMLRSGGAGLAANQIGIAKRFFVWHSTMAHYGIVINPVILNRSYTKKLMIEGCLSFPDKEKSVRRSSYIRVSYTNGANERVEEYLNGMSARIFQHEFDHLDGITIFGNQPNKNEG